MDSKSNKVRIDKWLWSIRFYKTRSIATKACNSGRAKINQRPTKASSQCVEQDTIAIKKHGITFTLRVLKTIDKRVGYKEAILCYEDLTPPEEKQLLLSRKAFNRPTEFREQGLGRPTKKDRREIDEFKWDLGADYDTFFEEGE